MTVQAFKDLFRYAPEHVFKVGVERECFLTDLNGNIGPYASSVLTSLSHDSTIDVDAFGYELSACQLEMRAGPCELGNLGPILLKRNEQLARVLEQKKLKAIHLEVAPEDMPLDVYPDPSGRYMEMSKSMPVEILRAACRVAGTHVHVGMDSHEHALHVYNYARKHVGRLCKIGDHSNGRRMNLYKVTAPFSEPREYRDWADYYCEAVERKFAEDPRSCWTLIRISKHGTVEFRMFGATESVDDIVEWAGECVDICRSAPSA